MCTYLTRVQFLSRLLSIPSWLFLQRLSPWLLAVDYITQKPEEKNAGRRGKRKQLQTGLMHLWRAIMDGAGGRARSVSMFLTAIAVAEIAL